jgi:hypothetical protein
MNAFNFGPGFSTIALYSVAFDSDKTFLLMSFRNHLVNSFHLLGETGWPGLLLWVVLPGWALARGVGMAWHSLEFGPLFVVAQFLAFLLIILFDYCIEMPYHKFAFFGVLAMVGALFAGLDHRRASETKSLLLLKNNEIHY